MSISTDGLICPFCQHLHDARKDADMDMFTENVSEWECYECEKTFSFSGSVSWCWTTKGIIHG